MGLNVGSVGTIKLLTRSSWLLGDVDILINVTSARVAFCILVSQRSWRMTAGDA
jgi:hypothetical protein